MPSRRFLTLSKLEVLGLGLTYNLRGCVLLINKTGWAWVEQADIPTCKSESLTQQSRWT